MEAIMIVICLITLAISFFTFQWGKGILYLLVLGTVGFASMALGFIGYIVVIAISAFFINWLIG